MKPKDTSDKVTVSELEEMVKDMSELEKSNMLTLATLPGSVYQNLASPKVRALARMVVLVATLLPPEETEV